MSHFVNAFNAGSGRALLQSLDIALPESIKTSAPAKKLKAGQTLDSHGRARCSIEPRTAGAIVLEPKGGELRRQRISKASI